MSAEQRYERLLRLYPRAWREERGLEILSTLMESAQEPRHSQWRESFELMLGALRARAGRATPASALRLAALVLLAHGTALVGAHAGRAFFSELLQGIGLALPSSAGYIYGFLAGALALLLVAAGRYALGALLTAVALAFQQWADSWLVLEARMVIDFWQFPLALTLLLPLLVLRAPGCRRPWLWLLAIPASLLMLPTAFDASLGLQPWAMFAVGAGCVAWSVVDARAGFAGGALMLGPLLQLTSFYWLPGWTDGHIEDPTWLIAYATAAVLLFGIGTVLLRRQTRM
jgi:hypothetical protein